MTIDNLEGKASEGVSRLEKAAGDAIDDGAARAKGEVRHFAGKAQDAVGVAGDAASRVAGVVREKVAKAGDHAADAYSDLVGRAQAAAERVEPFVKEKPYLAVGIAGLLGLVAGLVVAGRGPRVIYVKPRA